MLEDGLYDALITRGLEAALARLGESGREALRAPLDAAEAPEVLARHVAEVLRGVLEDRPPEERLELVNAVLARIAAPADLVGETAEPLLYAVTASEAGAAYRARTRPVIPLGESALLTNARGEPSLGPVLREELESADRVDLLCAFVKWHGIRVLEQPLERLAARGVPLRVLTTTYIGATDRRALDELARRFGAEVRISYELRSTRLHAKAWLFHRSTGWSTAYVGSSNLSRTALLDGLEWNVRLGRASTSDLLEKFAATFDSYWAGDEFEAYEPDREGDQERLDAALARAGGRTTAGTTAISLAGLEVRPFPHQVEMLEALETARTVRDQHRNLIVAATGTGKTVVAALDYRRLRPQLGGDPSLLFVAHRAEILDQTLRTYREVLADGAFGERYVGGARPERWRHVFASVQSLGSSTAPPIAADQFDVVVIDEFHHAEAPTYRRLLERLAPRELLGLTATPERSDGTDVRSFFDGRATVELRLWDALAAELLCPFHYFGVADDVDLSGIEWKRGGYDVVGLDRVYTGNDARTAKVLAALRDTVTDVGTMRALGFCVSVAHAEYMARAFAEAGITSRAVSGGSSPDERLAALRGLRDGTVQILFAVDLFNEGLDVPEVDTILLLRPTQSATVFLQQLGRGLRRAEGKAVLTVLDFIGQHRREFRFDLRYRALTGTSHGALVEQIEEGFPFLPSGCVLVLDEVAQAAVLANVRQQVAVRWPTLVAEVRDRPALTLAGWLDETERELADLYRSSGRSWTALRRAAGVERRPEGPDEAALARRATAFAHVDDPERTALYGRLLAHDAPAYSELSPREQTLARMCFFSLWPNGGGFASYAEGLASLAAEPVVRDELRQLLAFGLDRAEHTPRPLETGLQHVPLATHAHYSREEILAALGWATLERKPSSFVAGVAWCEATRTDAFLFTLQKAEREYSPSTMYRDYALSTRLFHWESQNATAEDSETGRRYREHRARGSHVLLFARQHKRAAWQGPAPYLCLGPATYVRHKGEQPMAITWELVHPLPADVLRASAIAS